MKGIITAAGSGTRLLPITKIINKTLLHAYDRPVIYYAIDALVKSGISDVMIVVPSDHFRQFEKLLEDGKKLGVSGLILEASDHSLGMPYSISQAKDWAGKEPVMVVPGDNIFLQSFAREASKFRDGAITFLRKVKDPSRFGVPVYKQNKVVDLIEKPEKPETNYAVVAPYIFDSNVYKYIESLKPSQRGELEITDLLKKYMKKSKLKFLKKKGFWKDVGTSDSLLEAGVYLRKWLKKRESRQ